MYNDCYSSFFRTKDTKKKKKNYGIKALCTISLEKSIKINVKIEILIEKSSKKILNIVTFSPIE